ncbi:hypothetical protein PRIPAC_94805 [Pristionchus pacificus]|uniref:Lipoprotein receptor n=1 Tax=Pristionchus pacificus TaxID=54126 RepID=A0A2A6BAU6_PRIPA|nr:hypothetical protein PRIPAC_94805 [Pristionchus pacificus]|eukprot:PDM62993.1 lipoprotein receptor [Pristionchus pacificus]
MTKLSLLLLLPSLVLGLSILPPPLPPTSPAFARIVPINTQPAVNPPDFYYPCANGGCPDCPRGCPLGQSLCQMSGQRCPLCLRLPLPPHCLSTRWQRLCSSSPHALRCPHSPNCVLPHWLRDGVNDCGDGSDEDPCASGMLRCVSETDLSTTTSTTTTTTTTTKPLPEIVEERKGANETAEQLTALRSGASFNISVFCEPFEFQCGSGECVLAARLLDGKDDCDDGSDEDYCTTYGDACTFPTKPCALQPDMPSFACGCPDGYIVLNHRCVNPTSIVVNATGG